MAFDSEEPGPACNDGRVLRFPVRRVDLFQLVFYLHGAGTRVRYEEQRAIHDAALSFDDGLLSTRWQAQRSTYPQVRSSCWALLAGCRGVFLHRGIPATRITDSQSAAGRHYSRLR